MWRQNKINCPPIINSTFQIWRYGCPTAIIHHCCYCIIFWILDNAQLHYKISRTFSKVDLNLLLSVDSWNRLEWIKMLSNSSHCFRLVHLMCWSACPMSWENWTRFVNSESNFLYNCWSWILYKVVRSFMFGVFFTWLFDQLFHIFRVARKVAQYLGEVLEDQRDKLHENLLANGSEWQVCNDD